MQFKNRGEETNNKTIAKWMKNNRYKFNRPKLNPVVYNVTIFIHINWEFKGSYLLAFLSYWREKHSIDR